VIEAMQEKRKSLRVIAEELGGLGGKTARGGK